MATYRIICVLIFFSEIERSRQLDVHVTSDPRPGSVAPALQDRAARPYKTIQANSTLLELLMDPDRDDSVSSEIFDMLHSPGGDMNSDLPTFPEDVEVAKADVLLQSPNMQAELVQESGEFVAKDGARRTRQRAGAGGATATAGVMLGVTCTLVLVAYLTLVVWKRRDMIRNGTKHELLRNEESANEARIEL